MAIRIKTAETAKELSDIYKLRQQVYIEQEGYFTDHSIDHIIDKFDTLPDVINVIAYKNGIPVGTIRINKDSDIGLPCDEHYDFTDYRQRIISQTESEGLPEPIFCSAGMLAIAEDFRNRRDLLKALFRMTLNAGETWGCTHLLITANVKSASIYQRLGFETISEPFWSEEIGEHLVALASPFDQVSDWARGPFSDKEKLLSSFAGRFQVYLADAGTEICIEGRSGNEAFLITKGSVDITRTDSQLNKSLHLATLGEGQIFGELALIDNLTRSATVTAKTNIELITLSRDIFWSKLQQDPRYLKTLLKTLAYRVKDANQCASLYAHANHRDRLKFFFNKIMESSIPSAKSPGHWLVRITAEEFARMANTSVEESQDFLATLQHQGKISVNAKSITFIGKQAL